MKKRTNPFLRTTLYNGLRKQAAPLIRVRESTARAIKLKDKYNSKIPLKIKKLIGKNNKTNLLTLLIANYLFCLIFHQEFSRNFLYHEEDYFPKNDLFFQY